MRRDRRPNGFSFIEQLIVLAVLSVIMCIQLSQSPTDLTHPIEVRMFFDELSSMMQLCQQRAILTHQVNQINFSEPSLQIIWREPPYTINYRLLTLPEGLRLYNTFNMHYLPSGRANKSGTIIFEDEHTHERYHLVIWIGNGAFEIRKA